MIYGAYEFFTIEKEKLDKLVILPQIRKTKNTKIEELTTSIKERGLINHPDLVKLNYEELKKHINFINQLWNKNVDINSFSTIDGYYYLVIAGHTRIEALKRIPNSNNEKDVVVLKIHQAKTSEEILAIQLDENIHKEVSIEERAIAIIGTYRLGIMNGKWNNKAEFIKENKNKFSSGILDDAVVFANLPLEIQEYVFSNNLPFSVGVELGRMYPLVKKYESCFTESETLLEQNIKLYYAILITNLQKCKSVKQALEKISGKVKMLNNYFRPKDEVQQEMINLWNDGVQIQEELHNKQLIIEYKKTLQSIMPYEQYIMLCELNTNLTGIDHSLEKNSLNILFNQYQKERFYNETAPVIKKQLNIK